MAFLLPHVGDVFLVYCLDLYLAVYKALEMEAPSGRGPSMELLWAVFRVQFPELFLVE